MPYTCTVDPLEVGSELAEPEPFYTLNFFGFNVAGQA